MEKWEELRETIIKNLNSIKTEEQMLKYLVEFSFSGFDVTEKVLRKQEGAS